jgi:hypothetical protein
MTTLAKPTNTQITSFKKQQQIQQQQQPLHSTAQHSTAQCQDPELNRELNTSFYFSSLLFKIRHNGTNGQCGETTLPKWSRVSLTHIGNITTPLTGQVSLAVLTGTTITGWVGVGRARVEAHATGHHLYIH